MLSRRELMGGAAPEHPAYHVRPATMATVGNRSECRKPNLNRLTNEGLQFERSYTPSAVCCPARAMILSGAYHWHGGIFNQVRRHRSIATCTPTWCCIAVFARARLSARLCGQMACVFDQTPVAITTKAPSTPAAERKTAPNRSNWTVARGAGSSPAKPPTRR